MSGPQNETSFMSYALKAAGGHNNVTRLCLILLLNLLFIILAIKTVFVLQEKKESLEGPSQFLESEGAQEQRVCRAHRAQQVK